MPLTESAMGLAMLAFDTASRAGGYVSGTGSRRRSPGTARRGGRPG
ncbi:hypothetical protein NKH77_01125 [Streptomyces sp. M19]